MFGKNLCVGFELEIDVSCLPNDSPRWNLERMNEKCIISDNSYEIVKSLEKLIINSELYFTMKMNTNRMIVVINDRML